uniref:YkgJ family cysteine cluster protein n=1 Tax=Ignisphaera aggregans TaxID=334771 RepID=A0A7C5XIZ5_9CREN
MVFEHVYCRTCLKCCIDTEMILVKKDINRIEKVGYKRDEFTETREGFIRLKNVEGKCIFLDIENRKCKIYRYRPVGCRIYPMIFDEDLGILIDIECPLADMWRRDCKSFSQGTKMLKRFLKELEKDYRYKVNWTLFKTTSMCKH